MHRRTPLEEKLEENRKETTGSTNATAESEGRTRRNDTADAADFFLREPRRWREAIWHIVPKDTRRARTGKQPSAAA
jgi:hypothetical protein